MKWSEDDGVSLVLRPSNHANGLTRDLQGRLIACEHETRRVIRYEHDGSVTVVANNYRGTRLNRPNDVIVKSDGCLYFTDPGAPGPDVDLDVAGVYRVTPDLGTLTLMVKDFVVPNGLAFNTDESILYINDTRRRHIRAFDMQPNGMMALASDRMFRDLSGYRAGVPDGMKVDVDGNVYCGGSGGIWVMDSTGKHLGIIVHGEGATTNVAFGGDDWKTLYFTTWNTVGRVQLKVAGLPVPTEA
jgi:gluconolactonase